MSAHIGVDDARTVVSAWREERALLRVEAICGGVRLCVTGRIADLSDVGLVITPSDSSTFAVVPLLRTFAFVYADFRQSPHLEPRYVQSLFIFPSGEPDAEDCIMISEFRRE